MEIIFYILIFLFIVMLIGHGMWVVLAWILRGGRPRESASYEPTVAEDRAATARHLEYLRREGFISRDQHKAMLEVIAEETHETLFQPMRRPAAIVGSVNDVEKSEPPSEVIEPEETPWKHDEISEPVDVVRAEETTAADNWLNVHQAIKAAPESKPPAAVPVPEPRRPFGEVLMSFMAEKNIRWGELVGGLLILCCSTALVISLWSQIEAIPVLKFVIFTSITAALFGVGLFVHYRWKLPTTGHALLIVSSLLVPLNLLAFAALSHKATGANAWTLGLELGSVALFGWLLLLAGRILLPNAPGLFAFGIIGLSAFSLLVRHLRSAEQSSLIWLCFVPVALYAAIIVLSVRRESHGSRISEPQARRLFLQLGAQTLACAVPLGLVFFELGQIFHAAHLFSPVLCALAAPAFVTGLYIYRRAGRSIAPQTPTVAMSISLVAATVMLATVALAWPLPSRLMPALLINAAAMIAVSRVARYAGFHAAAALWFSAAWVLLVHLVTGRVVWSGEAPQQMLAAILSAQTGQALVAPVLICLVLAEFLRRTRARRIAIGYQAASLGLAALSLIAITAYGFAIPGDTHHAAWVYLAYAVAAFALAWRMNTAYATIAGCILAQMALLQTAVYVWHVAPFPWVTSLLIGATIYAAVNAILRLRSSSGQFSMIYSVPLGRVAVLFSLLAVTGMAVTLSNTLQLEGIPVRMLWLAILWATLGAANGWSLVFAGAQVAGILALGTAVQTHVVRVEGYRPLAFPLREQPWVWQAHLLAASGLCLVFALARLIVMRLASKPGDQVADGQSRSLRSRARDLLNPPFAPVDRWFSALLIVAAVMLTARALWPAIGIEHGQLNSALSLQGSHQAASAASWAAIGILAAILIVHTCAGHLQSGISGLLIMLACGSALMAARFEAQHGVVVIWRFLLAGLFLITSGMLWTGSYWEPRVGRIILPSTDRQPLQSQSVQLWIGLIFAFPVLVLTAAHTTTLSYNATILPWNASEGWLRILLLGPSVLVAIGLFGYGMSERTPSYSVVAAVLGCAAAVGTEVCFAGRAGLQLSPVFILRLLLLVTIVSAGVALAWHAIRRGLAKGRNLAEYPSWPLLLVRAAMLLAFALLIAMVVSNPRFLHPVIHLAGSIWGLLAVVSVETALFLISSRERRIATAYRNSVWIFFIVTLAAFSVSRFDARNWLCFHVLLVGFTLAGCVLLFVGSAAIRRLVGGGWQQVFAVAIARASGALANIEHDLTCVSCGYNLRTQPATGRCPECGAAVEQSLDATLGKLTPDYAGLLAQARTRVIAAVLGFAAIAAFLAMRAAADDPQRPWWSVAVFVVLSGLCMALAGWAPQRSFAWLGGIGMCTAASVWYVSLYWATMSARLPDLINLTNVNIVALALAGLAWLVAERKILARYGGIAQSSRHPEFWPAFHHASLAIAISASLALACVTTHAAATGQTWAGMSTTTAAAWLAVLGLVIALRREPMGKLWLGSLYTLGVCGMLQILAQNGLHPRTLLAAISVGFAAYACGASIIERLWSRISRAKPASEQTRSTLWSLNNVLAVVSVGLALYISLNDADLSRALAVVFSPVLLALSAWMLSPHLPRANGQTTAVALAGLSLVLLAWVRIPPEMPAVLLHRAVGCFAAISITFLVCVATARWIRADASRAADGSPADGVWAIAVKRYLTAAGPIAAAALLYCAALETNAILQNMVIMAAPAVVAMIAALSVCNIACIAAGASSRFDPLQIRDAQRGAYVYIAEVLAALLALHIRATMPWLFTGIIEQYWPVLVLSIAIAAVAVGETLERRGLPVLGQPLSRTGTYLPLVTCLELFIAASRIHYSAILLGVGAFYTVLAAMRRSTALSLLAAASFNGSLWYLLYHTAGLGLTRHPQLWFIPPALAVLAAAHVNRARLSATQLRGLHYGCLSAIYLSSSADIFLIGVARAPWLPLVLAGLSVTGIFVGFALRLRSFLMLGMGFLCLSLFTMIWHAATNLGWTWVWYVAGIALGIAIITLFALFERKRAEMDAWVEHLKKWAE